MFSVADRPLRVLLVSGLFFPNVGGPATHVQKIAEHFSTLGWRVTIVAFGDRSSATEQYRVIRISRKLPRVLSWALYVGVIFVQALCHDALYAFDLTSSGFSVACAACLFRKPFLLRIGGDPIWERIAEKGTRLIPVREYYERGLEKKDRPLLFRLVRFVVRCADMVVVPNDMLKELYVRYYNVEEWRVKVILNPFSATRENAQREKDTFTFLFAGRFVLYKNLKRVVRVFARIYQRHPKTRLVFVGEGPEEATLCQEAQTLGVPLTVLSKVEQNKLFELIRSSSVSIAPALSEFNPNFIMETLALGKPALISRGNDLSVELPEYMQFDPEDEGSMEIVMERIYDPATYEKALSFVSSLKMDYRWENVTAAHEALVKNVTQS